MSLGCAFFSAERCRTGVFQLTWIQLAEFIYEQPDLCKEEPNNNISQGGGGCITAFLIVGNKLSKPRPVYVFLEIHCSPLAASNQIATHECQEIQYTHTT